MLQNIKTIAFDADDTLWHNEGYYVETLGRLKKLLSEYASADEIEHRLYHTEMANLNHFGYGIKSFTLSMIEMAIEVSEGRVSSDQIGQIIGLSKGMVAQEVEIIDGVIPTLKILGRSRDLMLITKGDLFEQIGKISRSGLAQHFKHIEVVSDKSSSSYEKLLHKYAIQPAQFLMVGNSLRSDILPVVALGGKAVYIPYHHTWEHEHVDQEMIDRNSYYKLEHIHQLPELLAHTG